MSGGAISWKSEKQSTIALSSTEAEYIAASEAAREIMGFRTFLNDIHYPQTLPTDLYVDNLTAINMTKEEGHNDRRKHINVKYHYIRERVQEKDINIKWIETKEQQADILTKPLPKDTFTYLRKLVMGVQE